MSESREDNGSDSGARSRSGNGQRSGEAGRPGQSGRSAGKQYDPVGDLQSWLIRQGTKSMANQVADNVRRTLGQQQRRDKGDVWDTATNEPPPDEAPECQWCPVCQAARRMRESGPGIGAKIADVGGALASVMQDAFTAVEQVMKTQEARPPRQDAARPQPPRQDAPQPPRQEASQPPRTEPEVPPEHPDSSEPQA